MSSSEIEIVSLKNTAPIQAGGSSKGCMPKYCIGNVWYKEDSVGYESLAEVLSYRAASLTNAITPLIRYELVLLQYANKSLHRGCKSISYLNEGDTEITLRRIIERIFKHKIVSESDYFLEAIRILQEHYGQTVVDQLSCLFQLDRVLINSDRHMNNIILRNSREIVSFDYGDALGADITYEFPESLTAHECISISRAKPTLKTHDEQCELLKEFSSFELSIQTSCMKVSDLRASVDESALTRMCDIIRLQFEKYLGTKLVFI